MADRHSQSDSNATRRGLLKALGATGAGASLAGCSGGGGGSTPTDAAGGSTSESGADSTSASGDDTNTSGGGGEPVTTEFEALATVAPNEIGFSPVGLIGSEAELGPIIMPGSISPLWSAETEDPYELYYGTYVKRHELQNAKDYVIEYKTDPQFKFENGKDLTIEDRYVWMMFDHLQGKKLPDGESPWESIEMINDTTIKQTLKKKTHPGNFFANHRPQMSRPRWIVRPWLEKLQDATTTSEAQKVSQNAEDSSNRIPLAEFPAWGMWKVEEVRDTEVLYTKNEHHPYSDRQNIEKYRVRFKGNESAVRLAWQNEQQDMSGGVPPANTNVPEGWVTKSRPTPYSLKFWPNRKNSKHLAKRSVRRALAYAFDNKTIAQNLRVHAYKPVEGQFGMPTEVAKVWLPDYDSFTSNMIDYGQTARMDKVTETMQAADYSRNSDGYWEGPDGEVVQFDILDIEWWPQLPRTLESQLERAGFKANMNLVGKQSKWLDLYANDEADWDALNATSGPRYLNYVGGCWTNESYGILGGFRIQGTKGAKGRDYNNFGVPWEVTIPEEVGAKEVSGSGQTINLVEERKIFNDPSASISELKEAAELFARYANFDVPAPHWVDTMSQVTRNDRDFSWNDINGDGIDFSTKESRVGLHLGINKAKTK